MFKQRKHKTFNYKPRFSKESQTDSSLDSNSDTKDFVSKWQQSKGTKKVKPRGAMSVKVLILILVLLLICMYVLEKKYM